MPGTTLAKSSSGETFAEEELAMIGTEETLGRDPRREAVAWGGPVVLGIALLVAGVLAISMSFAAGFATILVSGALLIGAGVFEIVAAFRTRSHGGFWQTFLAGLLSVLVGVALIAQPIAGLAAATALVGSFFVAIGLFRTVTSVVDRYEGWGWDLAYGILGVVAGALVLASWPVSALWLLGTIVGVELVARGVAWIAAGMTVRRALHMPALGGGTTRHEHRSHRAI